MQVPAMTVLPLLLSFSALLAVRAADSSRYRVPLCFASGECIAHLPAYVASRAGAFVPFASLLLACRF